MTNLSKYRRGLAKVAGVKSWLKGYPDVEWCPDENVEQAIQVLEEVKIGPGDETTIRRKGDDDGWFVRVKRGYSQVTYVDQSLPSAICLAVIQALGLKEDE